MRRIAAAIAAITLIAGTAHAQGHGGGNGRGNGGGGNENAMRGGGGGGGNADHGNRGGGNAERGNGGGNGPSMAQSMRGSDRRGNGGGNAERGNGDGGSRGNAGRGQGNDNGLAGGNDRGNRGNDRAIANDNRGRGNDNRTVVVDRGRGNGNRAVVIGDRPGRGRDVDVIHVRDFERLGPRGLIDGCPPGLAKKNPPCVPPGLARGGDRYDDDFRRVLRIDRPDFWGMRLDNGSYIYDDGYLLRVGREGRIIDYVPLLGGGLGIGQVWPSYYQPYQLPDYYEQYYGLGPYQSYRYADNVIYRLDPETAAISSIAALLTGDDFTVGQPMPLGYDIYNVPYGYRDQYVDGPDAYYRYADGYVYQVDPKTQLIAAAIQLLAS